jgi:hypothetical protein
MYLLTFAEAQWVLRLNGHVAARSAEYEANIALRQLSSGAYRSVVTVEGGGGEDNDAVLAEATVDFDIE